MGQYIYLLELKGKHPLEHPRLFKIGLSGNPDQRLAGIQKDWLEHRGRHVTRLKLVEVWDMDLSEDRLHEKFKDHRVFRDFRLFAHGPKIFTGEPLSGDTEWFHLPMPWDVFAVMVAMDKESRWAWLFWPIVGCVTLLSVAAYQLMPRQLPPVQQTQYEAIKWPNN
jgi:hypothetical protein